MKDETQKVVSEQDKTLIENAKKDGLGLRDSSAYLVNGGIIENPDLFEAYASNGEVADIGCSRDGPRQSGFLLNVPSINLVHLVDMFVDEGEFRDFNPETMRFHKRDGLDFLLEQKDAGNQMSIKTSSIDENVIGSSRYLERMAEVIYDVVPEDGFYVASASHTLQETARKLFPIHLDVGTDTQLFLKRQPTGYSRLKIDVKQIQHEFAGLEHMANFRNEFFTTFNNLYDGYSLLVEANDPAPSDEEAKENIQRLEVYSFDPQVLISRTDEAIEKLKESGDERETEFYLRGVKKIKDSVERNIDYLQRAQRIIG